MIKPRGENASSQAAAFAPLADAPLAWAVPVQAEAAPAAVEAVSPADGASTVTITGDDNVVNGSSSPYEVVDQGSGNTVLGGSGALTVFGSANGPDTVQGGAGALLYVAGAGGGDSVSGGAGGADVFGSAAGSLYIAGAGAFFVISGGAHDTVAAPAGAQGPVIFGAPGAYIAIDAAGSVPFVVAGGGDETIAAAGAAQGITFFGNDGATVVDAGTGGASFFGLESGNLTLSGGAGSVFELVDGHAGADYTIDNWSLDNSLYLSGYGLGAGDGITSAETGTIGEVPAVQIVLTDGSTLTFTDVGFTASEIVSDIHHI